MVWFDYLKEKGFFDPAANPEPVPGEKGFIVRWWEPLQYLEKLANTFKDGKNLEAIDDILRIIRNVSEHPKDNYTTWYRFIKILGCIPNERVPIDILDYIPIWLTGKFDSMSQTSELSGTLLPKFLTEQPSKADIAKAEKILKHLFSIQKKIADNGINQGMEKYYPLAYLSFIERNIVEENLKEKIARYCSMDVLDYLMHQIRLLLLDYPFIANLGFKHDDKRYSLKLKVTDSTLDILIIKLETDESIGSITINEYFELTPQEIFSKSIELLTQNGLENYETEYELDFLERIEFALKTDLYSAYNRSPIHKLEDDDVRYDEPIDSFALILRELLSAKAQLFPKVVLDYLNTLLDSRKYDLPFYKRMVLFIVAENWEKFKSIFWRMIAENDAVGLFSSEKYQSEIFYLLKKNQVHFTDTEIDLLKDILSLGPKNKDGYTEDDKQWKHRWYTALKDHPAFATLQQELTQELNYPKKNYEEEGKVFVRVGSESPYSAEEILEMPGDVLLKKIIEFKCKDRWEEPSIDGFAEALKKAVQEKPEQFTGNLKNYIRVPYIYIYHILLAFNGAWKEKKSFDWKAVLEFCDTYITSQDFRENKLKSEGDGRSANADWIHGAIADLITEGTRSDGNAFSPELLPLTKEILKKILGAIEPQDAALKQDMDYPMYVVNSTLGKTLRAIIDYSLRSARISSEKSKVNWEEDIRQLYDESLTSGAIDGYILQGMYFQQFCYLDLKWLLNNLKRDLAIEQKYWLAFIHGFAFTMPHVNHEIYMALKPHYIRAIEQKIVFNKRYHYGIIRHIIAFYFWGFDNLDGNGLVSMLINNGDAAQLQDIVMFVWQQESYYKKLNSEEKEKFLQKVSGLWHAMTQKFDPPISAEESEFMCSLLHLIGFIPELDEDYTSLIKRSAPFAEKRRYFHELYEELARLAIVGNSSQTAAWIASIMDLIPFKEFIYENDENILKQLVIFLYDHGQLSVANSICNRVSVSGMDFLKTTFLKYNTSGNPA